MTKTYTDRSHRRPRLAPILPWVIAAVLATGTAFAEEHSAGDIAQARVLLNQGIGLRTQGDAEGAVEKLRAAHALIRAPITGLELGRTYVIVGKLVEAREVLLSVERIPVAREETRRSAAARADAAKLAEEIRPRIPTLTIKVTGDTSGAIDVTLDGDAIPGEALPAPRLVNAGSHHVIAKASGGAHAESTVEIAEGEARDVALTLVPAHVAPAPAAETASPPLLHAVLSSEASGRTGVHPLVYAGFGLTAAGGIVGGVTGVMSLLRASSVKRACDISLKCPLAVDSDLQSAKTFGNVSTVAFAVGGVGAAVGILALVVWPSRERTPTSGAAITPWIAPGSAGLRGAF